MEREIWIEDARGRRRRARRGEMPRDGEKLVFSMTMLDAHMHAALANKYGDDTTRVVVDSAGVAAGHRPGFLHDISNRAFANVAGDAYAARNERLASGWQRKGEPDDDDDDEEAGLPSPGESEAAAREAAAETTKKDARSMTLGELESRARRAHADMVHRLANGWKTQ